jgi:hypothetical protein
MGRKIKIRIRDEHPGSYFRELGNNFFGYKILKLFDADPGSGIFLIRLSATMLSKQIFEKITPLPYEYAVSCLGDDRDR